MPRTVNLPRYLGLAAILGGVMLAEPGPATAQDDSAIGARDTVITAVGTFEIGEIAIGDRFPPDCENPGSVDCQLAREGYQVLVIWLEPGGGADHATIAKRLGEVNLFEVYANVRLVAADGVETESSSFGMMNDRFFVAFTPEVKGGVYELRWPGNAPVKLAE